MVPSGVHSLIQENKVALYRLGTEPLCTNLVQSGSVQNRYSGCMEPLLFGNLCCILIMLCNDTLIHFQQEQTIKK